MLEPKLPDRRAVVIPDLLLLGVEAHALPDDGVRFARVAPDREGHFEADGLRAVFAQSTWCALCVEAVAGGGAFEVRRDVAAHVEALHFDGCSVVGGMCVCVCALGWRVVLSVVRPEAGFGRRIFRARSQGACGGESAIIALAFAYARVKCSDT